MIYYTMLNEKFPYSEFSRIRKINNKLMNKFSHTPRESIDFAWLYFDTPYLSVFTLNAGKYRPE